MARREASKLKNKMMLDERPAVRMAASKVLHGALASQAPPPAVVECSTGGGPAAVSLLGLNLRAFSLDLLPAWGNIHSLDVSHNELCDLPGLEMLTELRVLDLCRNG
jgi:hypothetical protein